jgi:hypothetical protein
MRRGGTQFAALRGVEGSEVGVKREPTGSCFIEAEEDGRTCAAWPVAQLRPSWSKQAAVFVGVGVTVVVEQNNAAVRPQAREGLVVIAQVVSTIEGSAYGIGFDEGER